VKLGGGKTQVVFGKGETHVTRRSNLVARDVSARAVPAIRDAGLTSKP
jgi:hypothetical protein